jgi:hypothetical protein
MNALVSPGSSVVLTDSGGIITLALENVHFPIYVKPLPPACMACLAFGEIRMHPCYEHTVGEYRTEFNTLKKMFWLF